MAEKMLADKLSEFHFEIKTHKNKKITEDFSIFEKIGDFAQKPYYKKSLVLSKQFFKCKIKNYNFKIFNDILI